MQLVIIIVQVNQHFFNSHITMRCEISHLLAEVKQICAEILHRV